MSGNKTAPHSYVALDFLRGLAAFEVFLSHVRGSAFVDYAALPVNQKGLFATLLFAGTRLQHEAVLVFFVLSGVLVGGQVLRRSQEGRFKIRDYAIDRLARIFLPLIPACLITYFVTQYFFGGVSPVVVLGNMTALNGILVDNLGYNLPLWTLPYEIWFYIMAGALGYLMSQPRQPAWGLLFLVLATIALSVLGARFFLYWSLGAVCVLMRQARFRGAIAASGAIIMLLGSVTYQMSSASKAFQAMSILPETVPESLICVGIAMCVPYLCSAEVNHFLRGFRRPALYLSSMSYSLYLIHYPLAAVGGLILPRSSSFDGAGIGLFVLKLFVIFLLANIFYACFERNTYQVRVWLRRWTEKWRPEAV